MGNIARKATGLLDSKDALERMLPAVQTEYPDLTRGGLNNAPSEGPLADAVEEVVAAVKYMVLCAESSNKEIGNSSDWGELGLREDGVEGLVGVLAAQSPCAEQRSQDALGVAPLR